MWYINLLFLTKRLYTLLALSVLNILMHSYAFLVHQIFLTFVELLWY